MNTDNATHDALSHEGSAPELSLSEDELGMVLGGNASDVSGSNQQPGYQLPAHPPGYTPIVFEPPPPPPPNPFENPTLLPPYGPQHPWPWNPKR